MMPLGCQFLHNTKLNLIIVELQQALKIAESVKADMTPQDNWISTSDRLPEIGQVVWMALADGLLMIGGRVDPNDGDGWQWGNSYATMWHDGKHWDAEVICDDDYKVAYWMPLPSAPANNT